jgi:hypothetical protein
MHEVSNSESEKWILNFNPVATHGHLLLSIPNNKGRSVSVVWSVEVRFRPTYSTLSSDRKFLRWVRYRVPVDLKSIDHGACQAGHRPSEERTHVSFPNTRTTIGLHASKKKKPLASTPRIAYNQNSQRRTLVFLNVNLWWVRLEYETMRHRLFGKNLGSNINRPWELSPWLI